MSKPSTLAPGRTLALAAVGIMAAWSTSAGQAIGDKPEADTPPAAITEEVVQARRTQVEEADELDPAIQTQVLELYKQAGEQLRAAQEFRRKTAELEQERTQSPSRLAELRETLSRPPQPVNVHVRPETRLADLEQRLAQAEEELRQAQARLRDLEAQRKIRTDRQLQVPEQLKMARERLSKIEAAFAIQPAPGDRPESLLAKQTLLQAQRQALHAELAFLNSELPTYEAGVELLTLEIRDATMAVAQQDELVKRWKQLVDARRGREADQQAQYAQQTLVRLEAARAPATVCDLARGNVLLAERRVGPESLADRIRQADTLAEAVDARLKQLHDERSNVEDKLQIPGIEGVIGSLLLSQRRELRSVLRLERGIETRQQEIASVRLAQLELAEQSAELADLNARVAELIDGTQAELVPEEEGRLEDTFRDLLLTRQQLLDALTADYRTYFNKLVNLSAKEKQLVADARDFLNLIDQHILWIRSTAPLGEAHVQAASRAVRWLANPGAWVQTGEALLKSLVEDPAALCLAAVFFGAGWWWRRRQARHLKRLLNEAAPSYTTPFRQTLSLLIITLLLAAWYPALMWFVGWKLQHATFSSEFTRAVGAGLVAVAFPWFRLEALRRLCRPRGIAQGHFRWRGERLRLVRRHLRWLISLGMPVVFVMAVMEHQPNESYQTSLGRMALMGGLVILAVFLARVLRRATPPATDLAGHAAAAPPASSWEWARYPVLVAGPAVLILLAGLGYYYTAQELTWRLITTVWLGVGLLILHALAVRWLYVARARLALERVRQATESAAEASAADQSGRDDEPSVVQEVAAGDLKETGTGLAAINQQTRRLLRIAIAFSMISGTWLIWADVLPALAIVDYPLWMSSTEVTRLVRDAEGIEHPVTVTEPRIYTLADLILAVAAVTVAFVAAANVPGLLEVAVLQHLPLDSGGRYAAATLARYAFYIVGVLLGFSLLGLGWSKMQWLVAALGIGLGFGLQEIFGNFISGIILLFERPIRVGDIVTVENTSGVVTRIQMRATTVRNWDRREYIIPNKELITGRLLNWTLSDNINRVVVNVDVAYGSEPDLVRALLLKVAYDNPHVTSDPKPAANFDGFGESTLKFCLRAYVPSMDHFLDTVHELHTAVQETFARHNIEIAFPQRDLRIRTIEPAAVLHLSNDADPRQRGNGNGKADGHSVRQASDTAVN